ncbi:hypothetical protein R1sor_022269 [Riccia sorocarpa]|uniref:DUF4219 domain-containing protein n=1 Tax=Riccia sorocarpa TaxID=122646 RepID=A0ABD3GK35_9MARC
MGASNLLNTANWQRFDGTGYNTWHVQIKNKLEIEGYWEIVSNTIPKPRMSTEAEISAATAAIATAAIVIAVTAGANSPPPAEKVMVVTMLLRELEMKQGSSEGTALFTAHNKNKYQKNKNSSSKDKKGKKHGEKLKTKPLSVCPKCKNGFHWTSDCRSNVKKPVALKRGKSDEEVTYATVYVSGAFGYANFPNPEEPRDPNWHINTGATHNLAYDIRQP